MMAFNKWLSIVRNFKQMGRYYSTNSELVNVALNDNTGIAVVSMQRKPVNSLNLELLTQLQHTFVQLEKNKTRGVILTSAYDKIFSAGLDIMEMYKPDASRIEKFWSTLQDTWIALYGSSYPTVAAVTVSKLIINTLIFPITWGLRYTKAPCLKKQAMARKKDHCLGRSIY